MTTATIAETNIENWLQGPYNDEDKAEIRRLQKEDPKALFDAFYKNLEFGTGGMRGLMGVGTNRINRYTVGFVTQGIANYLHTLVDLPKRVALCFDSRNHSQEFAEEVAKIFLANDIEVFLYKAPRPVALISFAVRYHKCGFGVMITASHNPAAYNGYKVYGPDGSQVLWPHDENIIAAVKKINTPNQVKTTSLRNPKLHLMDEEIDKNYLKTIYSYLFHPKVNEKEGKNLKIVYTPLHGAGMTMIPKALRESGFTNLILVEEQTTFDGNFPTVKVPNPEEKEALSMGIALLKKCDGDCLIATDPDADRLAVVSREGEEIIIFNGHEIAVMLLEHICSSLKGKEQLPPQSVVIKTIVTTELFKAIADHYNVNCLEVLTGFKYIGQKMTAFEEENQAGAIGPHFIFGAEESYGYLIGRHVRDKDAIIASLFIAELALKMKLQQKNLRDFLYQIYKKYGIWREKLLSLTFPDKEGLEKMHLIMEHLRKNNPQSIGDQSVISTEDYLTSETTHKDGHKEPLFFPKSNVLRFWLADGSSLVLRPSGTEPKIKLYCSVRDSNPIHDERQLEQILLHLDKKALSLLHSFKEVMS